MADKIIKQILKLDIKSHLHSIDYLALAASNPDEKEIEESLKNIKIIAYWAKDSFYLADNPMDKSDKFAHFLNSGNFDMDKKTADLNRLLQQMVEKFVFAADSLTSTLFHNIIAYRLDMNFFEVVRQEDYFAPLFDNGKTDYSIFQPNTDNQGKAFHFKRAKKEKITNLEAIAILAHRRSQHYSSDTKKKDFLIKLSKKLLENKDYAVKKPFGELCRDFRKKRGMSRKKLAELIGKGETTISDYETGKIKNIPEDIKIEIIKELNLPLYVPEDKIHHKTKKTEKKYEKKEHEKQDIQLTGENIRKYRTKAGMTQLELAEKVGVNQSTIAKYECEKNTPCKDVKKKLIELLNTPIKVVKTKKQKDETIGELILDYIQENEMTQEDFGELIGKSGNDVIKYISGTKTPPPETKKKIREVIAEETEKKIKENLEMYTIEDEAETKEKTTSLSKIEVEKNEKPIEELIRECREEKGATYTTLGKLSGRDPSTISRYEKGKLTPSFEDEKKLRKIIKNFEKEEQRLFIDHVNECLERMPEVKHATIANMVGKTRSTISKYIRGDSLPSQAMQKKILEALKKLEEMQKTPILENIDENSVEIGKLIKNYIYINLMTQGEFAKLIGKNQSTISDYINGKITPSPEVEKKIREITRKDKKIIENKAAKAKPTYKEENKIPLFARLTKAYREKKNLKTSELEELLDFEKKTISLYEKGQINLSDNDVIEIINLLEIPINDIDMEFEHTGEEYLLYRIKKGISKDVVAERIGMPANFYTLFEKGKREPSTLIDKKIKEILEIPEENFYFECEIYRKARKKSGLTQDEVAELIGVSAKTYACYEQGRNNPLLSIGKKLKELFDL